jgi:hypothetical protein
MTSHEDSEVGWNTGLHSYFDVRHNKDGRFVSSTHRLHFTPKKFLDSHFRYSFRGPHGYWMRTEGRGHLNIFNDTTANRTQNLPSCGAVPQPTAPLAPVLYISINSSCLLYALPSSPGGSNIKNQKKVAVSSWLDLNCVPDVSCTQPAIAY